MLKSLISLFAEKFLQNKSEWVGAQVLPKSRISLDTSTKTYIAPSDGWIVFWGLPADVLEANITINGTVLLSSSVPKLQSRNLAVSVYLPVSKGQTVNLLGDQAPSILQCWFAPTSGSS